MDTLDETTKHINRCLGKQLLQARNSSGMSQKDITSKAGFSISLLNKYEAGENLPSIANLVVLSKLLHVPIDHLLQDYHPDFIIYAIDSYLARIDMQKSKSILNEVRNLVDGN